MSGLKGGTKNIVRVPGNGLDMKKALAGTRAFFQPNATGAFHCPMIVYPTRATYPMYPLLLDIQGAI